MALVLHRVFRQRLGDTPRLSTTPRTEQIYERQFRLERKEASTWGTLAPTYVVWPSGDAPSENDGETSAPQKLNRSTGENNKQQTTGGSQEEYLHSPVGNPERAPYGKRFKWTK